MSKNCQRNDGLIYYFSQLIPHFFAVILFTTIFEIFSRSFDDFHSFMYSFIYSFICHKFIRLVFRKFIDVCRKNLLKYLLLQKIQKKKKKTERKE